MYSSELNSLQMVIGYLILQSFILLSARLSPWSVTLAAQDREGETSSKGQESDDTLPPDEVDHALRPLPSEPIAIHRRSPLSKSKKVCSMEVSAT